MIGGGKYEKEVDELIRTEEAEVAAIIEAGGKRGSGFSVAIRPDAVPMVSAIVSALRQAADTLEKDLKEHNSRRWQ